MEADVQDRVERALHIVFGPLFEEHAAIQARVDEFFYRLQELDVDCVAVAPEDQD